jgi:Tfp pilus assembly ATPase PilU
MQAGGNQGMQTMDNALMELVNKDVITGQDAYMQANHKTPFERFNNEE